MVSGLTMKLTSVFIFSLLLTGHLFSQDIKEHIVTKTFYNKWNVTYATGDLFEYQRGSDDVTGEQEGVTVLYFPLTMIDDGIYGSVGIILRKEKKPEHILALSFPVGIGNKSYEDLANNDMSLRVLLMSGKDSVLESANYESMVDQVTVGGSEFKGRLYRFLIDSEYFEKLKNEVPNKMQLYFKSKVNKTKPKRRSPGGYISSENAMISKFSSLANSLGKVKILEIK
jgi:hypothetical protein